MKAQVIEQFGGPEVFQRMDIPRPEVLPGHVLIRVAASSVNPIDIKIRSGAVRGLVKQFPAILHGDVSGIVDEVGMGVTHLQVGDAVYACTSGQQNSPGGALADYLLADALSVARMPSSLSFQEAAVLPLVAITAWEALFDRARIAAGQKLLIHGAAGGVGHVAIQLAKAVGAEVYATASNTKKLSIARDLGADAAINYREETVDDYVLKYTDGKGFDVVFDTVGGTNLDLSFKAAKINGTVCAIAARSTHDLTPLHSKGLSLHVIFMLASSLQSGGRTHQGEILTGLSKWIGEKKVRPLVDPHSFLFSEIADAHRYLESGQAIGKVSLRNESFRE